MKMNRRDLILGFGATVGGLFLEEAIPLGRVWFLPQKIKIVSSIEPMLALTTEARVRLNSDCVALQLTHLMHTLPVLFESDYDVMKRIQRREPASVTVRQIYVTEEMKKRYWQVHNYLKYGLQPRQPVQTEHPLRRILGGS